MAGTDVEKAPETSSFPYCGTCVYWEIDTKFSLSSNLCEISFTKVFSQREIKTANSIRNKRGIAPRFATPSHSTISWLFIAKIINFYGSSVLSMLKTQLKTLKLPLYKTN